MISDIFLGQIRVISVNFRLKPTLRQNLIEPLTQGRSQRGSWVRAPVVIGKKILVIFSFLLISVTVCFVFLLVSVAYIHIIQWGASLSDPTQSSASGFRWRTFVPQTAFLSPLLAHSWLRPCLGTPVADTIKICKRIMKK